MKMQKTIATIIILTGSALTAWVSHDIAFPAILCMLGLIGLRRRFTWDFPPQTRAVASFLLLVLAVAFSLHYRYAQPSRPMGQEAVMAFAWQTVTRYFLASMILMLFLGAPRRLPLSLGLFHVAITICAGQILLLDDRFITFRLMEVGSVLLAIVYMGISHGSADWPSPVTVKRRPHWIAAALILLVAANVAWSVGSVLYTHVESLNYVPIWLSNRNGNLDDLRDGTSIVGFSRSGKLSTLAPALRDQDQSRVLTIASNEAPGYLRAAAFEEYRRSEWSDRATQEYVQPEPSNPSGTRLAAWTNVFRLDEGEPAQPKSMAIRCDVQFGDAMFMPLGTYVLEGPITFVRRDENDIVSARDLQRGRRYKVTYSPYTYRRSLNGAHRDRLLDIPPRLDPRIIQLAENIFAGCTTTDEKIAAVVAYFRSHYTYSLDLTIPSHQDALTYFLLETNTGYCEYFASGAAVLLRLADVPTRYVTGFLVTDRDTQAGNWIARNMDAHAWVEAWDEQRNRWTIVEATVPQDLSAQADESGDGSAGSGARFLLGRLLQALYGYGLVGIVSWFFTSYGFWPRTLVLTALLVAICRWALVRRRKQKQTRWLAAAGTNPNVVALHRLLAQVDRRVRAAKLRRHLPETLGAFARRIRSRDVGDGRWHEVSDWYLQYADLRYRRTVDAEQLALLQQKATRLRPGQ